MVVISVVVPTMRRPRLLARCLRALLAQDMPPDQYEIVVVDDAASDETVRQVASVASVAARRGLVVRYQVTQDGRHGPAAARNVGWRTARGAIIALTDDDCAPLPGWLRAGCAAFGLCAAEAGARQVDASADATRGEPLDATGVSGGGDALAASQPATTTLALDDPICSEDAQLSQPIVGVTGKIVVPLVGVPTDYERDAAHLEGAQFATANCFYRADALATVGGFDERFALAWREDSDLWFRLEATGARLVRAADAIVVHPVRPARWGVSLGQQRKSMYNALLYKRHPARYRERIQATPPWRYYLTVAALLVALGAGLSGRKRMASASGGLWLALTAAFCARRLRGTRHTPAHVAEMAVTSALIPPLSVYWRLRGALRFRVWFL